MLVEAIGSESLVASHAVAEATQQPLPPPARSASISAENGPGHKTGEQLVLLLVEHQVAVTIRKFGWCLALSTLGAAFPMKLGKDGMVWPQDLHRIFGQVVWDHTALAGENVPLLQPQGFLEQAHIGGAPSRACTQHIQGCGRVKTHHQVEVKSIEPACTSDVKLHQTLLRSQRGQL